MFAVVSKHQTLTQAIHAQLAENRRVLARIGQSTRVHAALLRAAQQQLQHAVDPLPAGDRAAGAQRLLAADEAHSRSLRQAISRLELALRPVALPVGFSSQSPSAIGSYASMVAERYLGVRYVWGGADPSSGFDCSGFVKFVYAKLGVTLPHYAASQYAATMHIAPSQLQPGDLVFFEPHADGPGHVGMYVGDGGVIEAPHSGDVVKLVQLSAEASRLGFVGASRPVA